MKRYDNEVYNIPLDRVAEALGMKRGNKDMWYSPFREESTASLHIDPNKNAWYDHGAGEGGLNVQLVMKVLRCDAKGAYRFLFNLEPSASHEQSKRQCPSMEKVKENTSRIQIKSVNQISSIYLKDYLKTRRIPLELAKVYCKELITNIPDRGMTFRLLGFPNNSGAYAMRSPSGFKSTNQSCITTLDMEGKLSTKPTSKSVAVFEGFFDFLSWQVLQSSKNPNCDIVVLNSVNNLKKAADYICSHDKVLCFLDNDVAGQKTTTAIEGMARGKEVIDMSDLYGQYKDLNEMLQCSRGYDTEMSLDKGLSI